MIAIGIKASQLVISEQGIWLVMPDEDMASLILGFVPEYMRKSSNPAPDEVSDLIRGAIKSACVMPTGFGKPNVLHTLLFNTYGANAPKIEKRADKLPYVWRMMADWIINQMKMHQIEITAARTDQENVLRVVAASARSLSRTLEASNQGETQTTPGDDSTESTEANRSPA